MKRSPFKFLLKSLIICSVITGFLFSEFGNKYLWVQNLNQELKLAYGDTFKSSKKQAVEYVLSYVAPEYLEPQPYTRPTTMESLKRSKRSPVIYTDIPFYYDHTLAPKHMSASLVLNQIIQSSLLWTKSCGVRFIYKGQVNSDYVANEAILPDGIGVIRWADDLKSEIVAQANQGDKDAPAYGFVMDLNNTHFHNAKDKGFLITTITHEMGHVIGLPHSRNTHSIMDATSRNDIYSNLIESDINMCKNMVNSWAPSKKSPIPTIKTIYSEGKDN